MRLKDTIAASAKAAQVWASMTYEPIPRSVLAAQSLFNVLANMNPDWASVVAMANAANGLTSDPIIDSAEIQALVHFQARWASFGFPIFEPTEDLSLSLMATSCAGIGDEVIELPFETFLIVLPAPYALRMYDDLSNTEVGVQAVAVHRVTYAKQSFPEIHTVPDLRGRLEAASRLLNDPTIQNEMVWIWCFPANESSVSLHSRQAWPLTFNVAEEEQDGANFVGTDGSALHHALRLVANLSLYLKNVKTDSKPRVERKSIRDAVQPVVAVSKWYVGNTIKLGVEAKRAIRDRLRGMPVSSPSVRFMVRGHWRNQAHGPEHGQRRLQWIEPFWKGPRDESGVLTRMYQGEKT